jgi:hypothetical protein
MKYGSPQGSVASLREHGNLHLGFTKAEYIYIGKCPKPEPHFVFDLKKIENSTR